MARRNAAEIATGAAVLLVAAGFLGFAVSRAGGGAVSGYPLYARFDHIDGLSVGADVRMAGVKVGSVVGEKIDPKTYLAVVKMDLRNGLELPRDSSATVTSDSLLGGKYLSLSPGGDETMLKPGGTITITQSSVSLEELLGKFIFSVTDMVNAVKAAQGGGKPAAGAPPSGSSALAPLPGTK
ncbi:MAG: outer membrane lipid asymmetry maintenance protein MlaD [Rhodospirillales bacterium]|nr:outer membrane lipid asymmetry maintenance protein MlaD [Rhodospirillales bacterium]